MQIVDEDPERPEVDWVPVRAPGEDFGSPVLERANARFGLAPRLEFFRAAEVAQLRRAARRDHYILRLQITVDHAVAVEELETL